jgi:pimeloyl-ACP methyl ester carboxylesterase
MLRTAAQLIDTLPAHLRLRATCRGRAGSSRSCLRFVDLGACVVRLREEAGGGPSLVLAADPPVPLERYDALIDALHPRWSVRVFEVPGFGASLPRTGFRYSMPNAVALVARLLESLPGAPHVLAMPCVTGFVALVLARTRPDLVRALVLPQVPDWNSAQRWLDGRDRRRILRTPVLGQLALAALRRRRIAQWYAAALGDPALRAAFVTDTVAHFDDGAGFPLASAFQDFLFDARQAPLPVDVPTLLLWGDADRSHRATDPAATRSLVPNATLLRRARCGHFPELEDPAAFAVDLARFQMDIG